MSASSWTSSVALVWATIVTTWFLVVYSRRGPWWHPRSDDPHAETRAHIGYFMLGLDALFVVYDFRPLFNPEVFSWIRAVLFTCLAGLLTWRLWILIRPDRRLHRVH